MSGDGGRERDFIPDSLDPHPETPFLRSDCTGQCVGVTGMSEVTHHGHHGHGHSHSHKVAATTSVAKAPAISTTVVPPTPILRAPPKAAPRATPRATPKPIMMDERRITNRARRSAQLETPLMTPEVAKRLGRALDLTDQRRTDFTYAATSTYQRKPPTPEWENPRMSRRSIHGPSLGLVLSARRRSLWRSFLGWWRGDECEETSLRPATPPPLLNGHLLDVSEDEEDSCHVIDAPEDQTLDQGPALHRRVADSLSSALSATSSTLTTTVTTVTTTVTTVTTTTFLFIASLLASVASGVGQAAVWPLRKGRLMGSLAAAKASSLSESWAAWREERRLRAEEAAEEAAQADAAADKDAERAQRAAAKAAAKEAKDAAAREAKEAKEAAAREAKAAAAKEAEAKAAAKEQKEAAARQAKAATLESKTTRSRKMLLEEEWAEEEEVEGGGRRVGGLCGCCPLLCCLLLTAALLGALLMGGAADKSLAAVKAVPAVAQTLAQAYLIPIPFLLLNTTRDVAQAAKANVFVPLWAGISHLGHSHDHPTIPTGPPPVGKVEQTVVHKWEPAPEPEVRQEDLARVAALIKSLEARLLALDAGCCNKEPPPPPPAPPAPEAPDLSGYATTTSLASLRAELARLESSLTAVNVRVDSIPPPAPPPPPVEKVVVKETVREVAVGGGGAELAEVEALVGAAIARYDADKTGRADFALESAGGAVISTRCSESYAPKTRMESVLGIPLWYMTYSPRVVIQPGVVPGECWAFKGPVGFLLVQLNGWVDVDAVSLEHIPPELSPDGHIESAPKDFQVWGRFSEDESVGEELGAFRYERSGPPLQTFAVGKRPEGGVPFLELKVQSNWGHPVYTCLYRLRVHGTRLRPAYGKP